MRVGGKKQILDLLDWMANKEDVASWIVNWYNIEYWSCEEKECSQKVWLGKCNEWKSSLQVKELKMK